MYLLVLSENLKTSLCSKTTVFPGFAGTFSFGARLTPLNLASLEKKEKQRFNGFRHSLFLFPLFFFQHVFAAPVAEELQEGGHGFPFFGQVVFDFRGNLAVFFAADETVGFEFFEGVCQGAEGGGFEAAFEFVVACGAVHHEAVDDAQFVFSLDEGHGVVESGVRDAAFEFFVRKFQVHLHRPFFPMMVLRVSGAGKYYILLHTLY